MSKKTHSPEVLKALKLNKKRDPIDGLFEGGLDDFEKLHLLCIHYGIEKIDPDVRFILLSLYMARDLIPAFQDKKKPGRHATVEKTAQDMVQIYLDVQSKVRETGCSEREACKLIDSNHNFRNRYNNAKKHAVIKLVKRVYPDYPEQDEELKKILSEMKNPV